MTYDFEDAVNGAKGELDGWLECNNEAEVRAAIQKIMQERDELRTALHTQAEESAKLIEQRDWLLAAINAALHQMRHTSYHPCKTEPMGILDAAIEKATN